MAMAVEEEGKKELGEAGGGRGEWWWEWGRGIEAEGDKRRGGRGIGAVEGNLRIHRIHVSRH